MYLRRCTSDCTGSRSSEGDSEGGYARLDRTQQANLFGCSGWHLLGGLQTMRAAASIQPNCPPIGAHGHQCRAMSGASFPDPGAEEELALYTEELCGAALCEGVDEPVFVVLRGLLVRLPGACGAHRLLPVQVWHLAD